MNFAAAAFLWGQATNQENIRDLGVFLHTTERTAIEQYWFDIDNVVFPQSYPHNALGIVWGGKGAHTTWFGGQPEFIHGINLLPITSSSLYLGYDRDYVLENYNEVVAERGSQPIVWKDVFWEFLSLADPDLALSYYLADPNYDPFDGESRAHTMHWLYNLKAMGAVYADLYADIDSYAVFKDDTDHLTYVVYNSDNEERFVTFTDGYSMTVPAKSMKTESTIMTTSIEDVANNPNQFVLSQNYPNPFNPETQISYSLPTSGDVTLEVYSMLGQKVSTLVSIQQQAGSYSINFDASSLASGMYFYRLKFNNQVLIKKMTLLK
jgi:hypothetical protein